MIEATTRAARADVLQIVAAHVTLSRVARLHLLAALSATISPTCTQCTIKSALTRSTSRSYQRKSFGTDVSLWRQAHGCRVPNSLILSVRPESAALCKLPRVSLTTLLRSTHGHRVPFQRRSNSCHLTTIRKKRERFCSNTLLRWNRHVARVHNDFLQHLCTHIRPRHVGTCRSGLFYYKIFHATKGIRRSLSTDSYPLCNTVHSYARNCTLRQR